MKQTATLLLLLFTSLLSASEYEYKFRLSLKNKGTENGKYQAQELLSKKALDRRAKQNISIDTKDYPFSDTYLQQIENLGARIVAKSKWNNTVAINITDSSHIDRLKSLPFIDDITLVWRGKQEEALERDTTLVYPIKQVANISETDSTSYYGKAYQNIKTLNGDYLHSRGYKGKGMTIAVIDAGFRNVPVIEYFDNINILGHASFVDSISDIFQLKNQHGTNVLSCIATNKPYYYVGTAPEADFLLLNSEDPRTEYPIEEDYWSAAIEYADSIGVDVVNTSLGYINYHAPIPAMTHDILDGQSLISRSASIATTKGMLVVVSAGNAGSKDWKKISPPGDAEGVLTVGAIAGDSIVADFSSIGLTKDLRVKPDVMALGSKAAVIDAKGNIAYKNGTSFATPIMCGLAACLWQAFPQMSNIEILDIIRESADRHDDPNIKYGFGIPDMKKAMEIAGQLENKKSR